MAKEKEEKKSSGGLGVAGFTLGIVSLAMFLFYPVVGFATSVIGFFLCLSQQRKEKTKKARIGMILNAIGFVLNVAMFIIDLVWLSPYVNQIYAQQLNSTLTSSVK
ncbi:MAG: hypothetical protein WAU65_02080 [Candidatus Nanoarchaeia archaeon]